MIRGAERAIGGAFGALSGIPVGGLVDIGLIGFSPSHATDQLMLGSLAAAPVGLGILGSVVGPYLSDERKVTLGLGAVGSLAGMVLGASAALFHQEILDPSSTGQTFAQITEVGAVAGGLGMLGYGLRNE